MIGAHSVGSMFSDVPTLIGGLRPVQVNYPTNYKATVPAPLLILLHGYGVNGAIQDNYFGLANVAKANGMVYLYPNGIVDFNKARYWKATDACCDFLEVG